MAMPAGLLREALRQSASVQNPEPNPKGALVAPFVISRRSYPMSNSTKPSAQPITLVFGLSSIGKPRAGTFKASEVTAARKAADKLGFKIVDIDQATAGVAAKVPAGRIGGSADSIVPFISKELYTQIKALADKQTKNGKPETPATLAPCPAKQSPRLPQSWTDIKVGDLVLAQDTDPADGWWQVTVMAINGDLCTLRWPSGRGRPFQKHRTMLGLICPGEIKDKPKPDPKRATSDASTVYPGHWSTIGVDQIVLAKEDGPCQQWWEAKTVKLDKDVFSLQWRDNQNLPTIIRTRSTLGLVHPAPKSR
jgi:hypothetical protein